MRRNGRTPGSSGRWVGLLLTTAAWLAGCAVLPPRPVVPAATVGGEPAPLRPWAEVAPLPAVAFTLNGQGPFTAIVDTGNGTTGFAVSASLARMLQLQAAAGVPDSAAAGVGGRAALDFALVERLAIGGVVFRDLAVGVTPAFDRLGEVVGVRMDGNLGYGLLRHYRVELDWAGGWLRLLPSAPRDAAAPDGTAFRVAPGKPLVVTSVAVCGGRTAAQAVFDSGAAVNLVSPALAARLGLPLGEPFEVQGVSGRAAGRVSTIDRMVLAGRVFEAVDVVVSTAVDEIARLAGVPVDLVLGPDLVGRRVLVIDYPARWLSIRGEP